MKYRRISWCWVSQVRTSTIWPFRLAELTHWVPLCVIGGIPYIAASGTTLWLAKQAQIAASGAAVKLDPGVALTMLDQALNFQVAYGAVMLAALGAQRVGFLETSHSSAPPQVPCNGVSKCLRTAATRDTLGWVLASLLC